MKKLIPLLIIVTVIVGGGAFYSGMKYGASKKSNAQGNFQGMRAISGGAGAIGARAGRQAGGGFNSGEIIAKDDKSITIKLRDGGSKIVFFSQTTSIGKMTTGSINDLVVGTNVTAAGKTNSDNSITADTIQIRPAMPPGGASQVPTTPPAQPTK